MKSDIKSAIQVLNADKLVKIRLKETGAGNHYFVLDLYCEGKRTRISTGIKYTSDKRQQAMAIRKITILRDQYEHRFRFGAPRNSLDYNLPLDKYADIVLADKLLQNKRVYMCAVRSFLKQYPGATIGNITRYQAAQFQRSLLNRKPATINHYIQALSLICKSAVKDSILESNPFDGLRVKQNRGIRNFLSLDEIQILVATDCFHPAVKNAFLFSCFTGLRLGDITALNSSQIIDGYIVLSQGKTGAPVRILIPNAALALIDDDGLLFKLPSYKYLRKYLAQWISDAGIKKHITFHCARHTFATLQLT
ncbi:MAG: site-specific integrase, partial [Candidatus Cloacimonetes bacterium]|nr:site-specific integrase [Candidatus Cloacimonadota bacterium]